MFIKVTEHKTRPVKRAGSRNSRQRVETGSVQSSLQSRHEAERVMRRRSAPTGQVSVPTRRQSGKKPQNTAPGAPGQELRKQRTGETGGR